MPFVHITWLPKTCRTAAIRQKVADAVIKVKHAHTWQRELLDALTTFVDFVILGTTKKIHYLVP